MKVVEQRENGTQRVQLCFSKSKQNTDQSYKKSCDINLIMNQYQKTGLLPHIKDRVGQYMDVSNAPDLIEAHEIVQEAKELFDDLPVEVRRLMDYDPSKLVNFVSDEKNYDLLVEHGIMQQKAVADDTVIDDQAGSDDQGNSAGQ